jgi:hypothetical protein
MRSPGSRGALSVLFVFYLLGFLGCLLWCLLSLPELFPHFRWPYLWAAAFVRFVDYAIPITAAGLAVAYSLFLRGEGQPRQPFHRVVGSQLTLLVALTILYTVVLLGFYPRSRTLLSELVDLTRQGRELLAAANENLRQGREQAALDALERYLATNPRDQAVADQRDALRQKVRSAGKAEAPLPRQQAGGPAEGRTADQYLQMARGYFDKQDWYSAIYYAGLAEELAGRQQDAVKQGAVRLASRSWDKVRGLEPSAQEAQQKTLYREKRAAFEKFDKKDYLSAYYYFRQFASRYPKDADAQEFLKLSEEKVAGETYFLDEAERMDPLPGSSGLLFVNPRADGLREIVSIGKMVTTSSETYLKDVEVLRVGPAGVQLHYLAPYGKLAVSQTPPGAQGAAPGSATDVLLHGIDRSSKRQSLPRLLRGSLRSLQPDYLLHLAPRREELAALRAPGPAGRERLASVGLDTLWLARRGMGEYGQLQSALSMEILMRLLLPFAFLNLGLLAMALGWGYRLLSPRRPAAAWLAIPLFPVGFALLALVYLNAHRILAAFALNSWGFRPALVGLAVLQGAILAVMLIVLAGQSAE